MKKIFWLFALFAVAVSARDFDFTNGKVKNFRAVAAKKAAFVAGKGFVAADGTRLVGSNLGLDAAAIERIEVVTGGEKLKFSKLYFDADGKNFAESKVVRGIQKGDRVIFDFAGKNNWQGQIGALRFDFHPEQGMFTVKKINIPESIPGVPSAVDFTSGIKNKWHIIGSEKVTLVTGRGLVAVNRGSMRLMSPKLVINTDKVDMIEVAVSGKTSTLKLYYTAGKEPFSENKMVRGSRVGDVIKFDLCRPAKWTGEVNKLRIDLYGDAGSELVIKGIRFGKGDGPNAVNSPFDNPVQIAPGASVAGVCEFSRPVKLSYRINTTVPVKINAVEKNIYGKEIARQSFQVPAGKSRGEFGKSAKAAFVDLQVVNESKNTASFQMKFTQGFRQPVKAPGKEIYQAEVAGFPAHSDENTVLVPQVTFPGKIPAGKELVVRLKSAAGLDIIVADQQLAASGAVKLPKLYFRHLSPGKYTVSAYIDDVECSMPEVTFTHERKTPVVPPRAVVARNSSRPYYIINGSETADALEHLSSDPPLSRWAFRQIFNAVDNGIESIRLRLIFRFDGQNQVDFREYDSALQTILLRAPHVNIMFHVSVTDPGPKWRGAHPEEGIKDDKGEYNICNYRATPEATSSMASVRWVEDSKTMLRKLVGHLNSVPCGERVIGVLPCSGITWEWLHWGSARGVFVDYSEHYRRYFIGYLRQVYGNDIAKLNAAWHTELKSFDEVKVPSPQEQKAADMSEFRTPEKFQYQIDYTESLAALVSGIINDLCKTVKESSDNRLISGTYYGYITYLNGSFRAHQSGHYALNKLLRSPHLDILMAPSRYAGRRLGGATGFMFPEGSVNLHGKLIISECDDRPINASSQSFRAGTLTASRSFFERALALQLSGNAVMRYFDFSKGWVADEPRLLEVLRETVKFDTACRKADPSPLPVDATAGVFVAERSMAALNPTSMLQSQLLENGYCELASSGMSFRMFCVEDIQKAAAGRKMLVFPNCFRLRDSEKSAIKTAINGKNVLIVSGLGLFDNAGKLDLSFMQEIFNCKFKHSSVRAVRVCRTTEKMEKLFGIPRGTEYRAGSVIGDVFYPQGSNFTVLAETADGDAAIAAFEKDGRMLIYAAHPVMPAALLKALARKSGMPVIDAGDAAVWYGSAYAMVHTDKAVTAAVELPAGFSGIVEYPDLKYVPASKGKIIRQLAPAETWMFYLKK